MRMGKKIELKLCPFCGGEAEFQQFANPKNFWKVVCKVCNCGTDGHRNNKNDNTNTENKEIQAAIWNRRSGG